LLAAIYKFHFGVAALLKEVPQARFMPAKLSEFARSRLIAIVAIYKFDKPIQRPSIGRYAMLRMAIRLNARHVFCCEQTASLPIFVSQSDYRIRRQVRHEKNSRPMPVLSFKRMRAGIPLARIIPIFLRSSLPFTVWSPCHFPVPVLHHWLGIAVIAGRRDVLTTDPRIKL
jgi:hypothetical protein